MKNLFRLDYFNTSSESGESEVDDNPTRSIYELRTVKPARVRSILESFRKNDSITSKEVRELRTLINKAHAPVVAIASNYALFKEVLQKIGKNSKESVLRERGYSGTLLDLYQEIEYKAKISSKFLVIFQELGLKEEINILEAEIEEIRREGIERRKREKNQKNRKKKQIKAKLDKFKRPFIEVDPVPLEIPLSPLFPSSPRFEIPLQWEVQDQFQSKFNPVSTQYGEISHDSAQNAKSNRKSVFSVNFNPFSLEEDVIQ